MPQPPIRLLLIDDDEDSFVLVRGLLGENHRRVAFELDWESTYEAGLAAIRSQRHDAYLVDYRLGAQTGLDLLKQATGEGHRGPFIIITGHSAAEMNLGPQALVAGAADFLSKDEISPSSLARSVMFAVEQRRYRIAADSLQESEEDFKLARAIQQKMLHVDLVLPDSLGIDAAWACQPAAATGGDFFDLFTIPPEEKLVAVVADVSSHGFAPALVMAATRRLIRTLARLQTDPGELMLQVNDALLEDTPENVFVTMFLLVLDTHTRKIRFAGAGHEAFLLTAGGEVQTLASTSLPLGIDEDADFSGVGSAQVSPGDTLILLSDGLQESRSPQGGLFGLDRIMNVVRERRDLPTRQIVESLFQTVFNFCHPGIPADDLTAVIIKVAGDRGN